MKNIFLVTLLALSTMIANDDLVIKYEKKIFSKNSNITLKDVTINTKKKLKLEGWYAYIIDVTAMVQDKELKAKDILFSNGEVVTPELFDIKNGKSLRRLISPKLTGVYYNKAHLIAGNHNAKYKIVVFSDPLCPFCMDYIPDVINHVQKNKNTIALYYYHFPLLRIHPASKTLAQLMDVARNKKIKDVELKVYNADWDRFFSEKEKNSQKIIDGFNNVFKTTIKLEDLMTKDIINGVTLDMKMGEEVMVQGTPTIFINGQKDNSKLQYETLGK